MCAKVNDLKIHQKVLTSAELKKRAKDVLHYLEDVEKAMWEHYYKLHYQRYHKCEESCPLTDDRHGIWLQVREIHLKVKAILALDDIP